MAKTGDKKAEKIEVSYANGFLVGRMASTVDEEDGTVTVAGSAMRVRMDDITAYCASEPGTVLVYLRNSDDPFEMVGSVGGVDKALARHTMVSVPSASE